MRSQQNRIELVNRLGSFSAYKYVAMIVVLLTGLLLQSKLVYYLALIYVSAALGFFLLRTLKLRIEPEVVGNKGESQAIFVSI